MSLGTLQTFLFISALLGFLSNAQRSVHTPALPPSTAKVGILLPVFCDRPGSNTLCHEKFFAKIASKDDIHDFFQSLYFEIETRKMVNLISQKTIEDVFYRDKDLAHGNDIATFQMWWPKILQEAQEQHFTYLVIPLLYHYQERLGTEIGIEKPASIAFELVTFRVSSGSEVRRQSFEETQQSLSEDPLEIGKIFKRRGRWISARDLTREASRKMIGELEETFRS